MAQVQFRTRQEETDYHFVTDLLDQMKAGKPLTQDQKVCVGFVARRAPGPLGKQALALYTHLMSQEA